MLFLRRALLRGSKRRDGRIHVVFVARTQYPNNTKHATVTKKEERKDKRKEKKMYLGFSIFLKKEETNQRDESTLLSLHARALHYSCSFSVEQKKRTRNNVGWNAVRAPSHAEGTKATLSFLFFLSFFLSDVFVSSFYEREMFVFSNDERVLPPSSRKLSIGVDFSL